MRTGRRSSPTPSRRSDRPSRTRMARTIRPSRRPAATRQLRHRTTPGLPYRTRAPQWAGSASTLSRVVRGSYSRPATAAAWSARSRRARPITVWPSATAASISRAPSTKRRARAAPGRAGARGSALVSLPLVPRWSGRGTSGTAATCHTRSTTAARHNQPWPRPVRLGGMVAVQERPGARVDIARPRPLNRHRPPQLTRRRRPRCAHKADRGPANCRGSYRVWGGEHWPVR